MKTISYGSKKNCSPTSYLQYEEQGLIKFLKSYLVGFYKNFRQKEKWSFRAWFESYTDIPHEIEARKLADEFMVWLKAR